MGVLGKKAMTFAYSFSELRDMDLSPHTVSRLSTWTPPTTGYARLNFDGGSIGDNLVSWGFVFRDHDGNVLLAGVKHCRGFAGASVEEARACLQGLIRAP